VFDIPTMTRLAVGPAWRGFSAEQQGAVRDAFARSSLRIMRVRSKIIQAKASSLIRNRLQRRAVAAKIVKTKLFAAQWANGEHKLPGP